MLLALLLAEFLAGVMLLNRSEPPAQVPLATIVDQPAATGPASTTMQLPGGRHAQLIALGGAHSAPLLNRIAAELPAAADAVSRFWGPDWRREIVIVATASDRQFAALAGGGADIAAATTAERIVFAPGSAGMSDEALRIVVRHELFHHAVRDDTAADAPRWLTEGVADYIARPADAAAAADAATGLPSDRDLDTPAPPGRRHTTGPGGSPPTSPTGTARPVAGAVCQACGPGHSDVATAVRDTLGADLDEVLADWRHWPQG